MNNNMFPKVVLYNAVSLDGRITDFPVDLGLFYGLAGTWEEDVTLAGSETILSSGQEIPNETDEDIAPQKKKKGDKRPVLAVVDSRGRVRIWHFLRKQPYWRDYVALCSKKTPAEYLEYLDTREIDYIIAGEEKVDLKKALSELRKRYKVRVVRVDSGGTLNGVLLREGLVDEISLLIHPCVVGGKEAKTFYTSESLSKIDLSPVSCRKQKNGTYWVRYKVVR